jgi:hypothetical protein
LKARARVGLVFALTTALFTLGNLGVSHPAGADPAFVSSYIGVGSDTIQDVMNAYSGAAPYPPNSVVNYGVPLHSSAGSGNKTLSSFDAVPQGGSATAPGCITTKLGGPSFDRPNGSSNGIAALSHSIDGTGWQAATASCTAGTTNPTPSVQGQIDFARSSRGPSIAGTALNFIPFARDAVSYAYWDHSANVITNLSTANLQSLYSSASGQLVLGTQTIKACITQQGSGTTKFWEGAIGVTDSQAQTASAASGCTANPSTLEENGGNSFFTFASTLGANIDAVVDFSAGSWISQANGVALDRSATARTNGVDLGSIDTLPKPYTGTPGTEVPASGFYASTQYGRDLYVVVATSRIGTFGDAGLKSLFVGTGSAICAAGAQSTAHSYGFDSFGTGQSTCGDTTLSAGGKQGALYS